MAIIDDTKRVKVEDRHGREHALLLQHRQGGGDSWQVVREHGGEVLGSVRKTTYTYSPPTHRGSRIARHHHQVKAWVAEVGFYPDSERTTIEQTRKACLVQLLHMSRERSELRKKLMRLREQTPEATFRLNRGRNGLADGWIGTIAFEGPAIFVTDPKRPEDERRQRVTHREVENDVRPCLEFHKSGRWEPVANLLWSMED